MPSASALREHDDMPSTDHIVVLHDIAWNDYERLLEMRGDHSAPRISYLEGEVEIMSRPRTTSKSRPTSDISWRCGASIAVLMFDLSAVGRSSGKRTSAPSKPTNATSLARSRGNARNSRSKSSGPGAASTSSRSTASSASTRSGSGAKE